jgi:predicted enzyme related to lactoylglutathione lyase
VPLGTRVGDVAIDCNDVAAMTAFWSGMTGYTVQSSDETHGYLADPAGRGPDLFLQQVPEPRVGKNRLHLDLVTDDLGEAGARVLAMGGSKLRDSSGGPWLSAVFLDPEGNQFCVSQEIGSDSA